MSLRPGEHLIHDSTSTDVLFPTTHARGYVERDFAVDPPEMFDAPSEIELIPQSEWSDRIKEQSANKSRVSDLLLAGDSGKPIPSMDQDGVGYCWAHSTTGCVQAVRAIANLPYVPLSAFAVAATIKQGRDEGGWCGLSAKFARERGIPSQKLWPQQDRNYRLHDTPEVWADAALHKVTEDWYDLAKPVYDQALTFNMVATLLLSRIPCAVDFNWWSHSVMACDLVEVEPGSFGIRIRNSWGDGWGDRGFSVLQGSKARPDGAVAIRVAG